MYHALGRSVLERGWKFVTYEGPGQPTVRRQQGLGFRPDYLRTLEDVDPARMALQGTSVGGTLAPRVANREHRLALCWPSTTSLISIEAS